MFKPDKPVTSPPELQPKNEVLQKLQSFPQAVQAAYSELVKISHGYLAQVMGIEQPMLSRVFNNKMEDFIPLRRAQIQQLLDTSEKLGIPLNPVGEITFTPGSLDSIRILIAKLSSGIAQVSVRDATGVTIEPAQLRGPHKKVGFWMAQSPIAYVFGVDAELKADYLQAHDQQLVDQGINDSRAKLLRGQHEQSTASKKILARLKTPAPFGHAPISPFKFDVRDLHRTINHEAEHTSMIFLNNDLVDTDTLEGIVMSEFLAYRADYLSDPSVIDGIIEDFPNQYLSRFGRLSNEQFDLVKKLADRIFCAIKDDKGAEMGTHPEYQANISAIAMVAKSAAEFLELCTRVIDNKEAIPEITEIKRVAHSTIIEMRTSLLG
jgi:hypothetical protein